MELFKVKKVLIIEDSRAEVEALIKVVKRVDAKAEVITAGNIGAAMEYAVTNSISLFIVDIVLVPSKKMDTSGIDFVETIRNMPQYKYIPVIFVSSLNDSKMYAYQDLHCYSYIQKPLFYSEVEPVVKDALELSRFMSDDKKDEKPLNLKQDNVLYVIQKRDIIYASSKAGKMTIVTEREKFVFFYLTCKDLMEKLESDDFIQCSRSTIVNRKHINSIDKTNSIVQFRNCKDLVQIGKIFKKGFLKEFYGDN